MGRPEGGVLISPGAIRRCSVPIAAVLLTVLVALYYMLVWPDSGSFTAAMDEGSLMMEDFNRHMYPTASAVLTTGEPSTWYMYSAFFALLISPLGLLPRTDAAFAWGALQMLFVALLVAVPMRRLGRRSRLLGLLYYLLVITSVPVLHNFRWGQVSTPVTVLVIASLLIYDRRPLASALLLALAAAVKFYPALFAVYYLYRRDRRTLAVFAVAAASMLLLPALVLSPAGLWEFERSSAGSIVVAPWVARSVNSLYAPNVLGRLWPALGEGLPHVMLCAASAVVPVLVIRELFMRGREEGGEDTELFLCCGLLCLPFILKTSWPHYFVYLPYCQVTALVRLRRTSRGNPARAAVTTAVVLSMILGTVPMLNAAGGYGPYNGAALLLVADVLLLPALLLRKARLGQSAPTEAEPSIP